MMKAVISLSGGMDSATALGRAKFIGYECHCVGFTYGSTHNEWENEAARALADHYKVEYIQFDLSSVMDHFDSALIKSQNKEIPEGHYEEESMSQTVVPGRNIIFLSILSGYAWSIKAEEVWLGIHSGDHAIYPDCRPEFFHSMRLAIEQGTEGNVWLKAPFLDIDKTRILREGFDVDVPYHLTRTCYKNQRTACGKCGACQERLEAFRNIGKEDPIEYETREILPKK